MHTRPCTSTGPGSKGTAHKSDVAPDFLFLLFRDAGSVPWSVGTSKGLRVLQSGSPVDRSLSLLLLAGICANRIQAEGQGVGMQHKQQPDVRICCCICWRWTCRSLLGPAVDQRHVHRAQTDIQTLAQSKHRQPT